MIASYLRLRRRHHPVLWFSIIATTGSLVGGQIGPGIPVSVFAKRIHKAVASPRCGFAVCPENLTTHALLLREHRESWIVRHWAL